MALAQCWTGSPQLSAGTWQQVYGTAAREVFNAAVSTADGGYLFGGYRCTNPEHNTQPVYWVVKTDSAGNEQWEKTYGGAGDDYLRSIVPTADGGFLLSGESNEYPVGTRSAPLYGGFDVWVIKIDAQGNKVWDQSYGGTRDEGSPRAIATADGGYLIGCWSISDVSGNKTSRNFGGSGGTADFWVVKIGPDGQKQWDKSYGGNGNEDLEVIVATPDGGALLGGSSSSAVSGSKTVPNLGPVGTPDFYIVKIDAQGNQQWDRAYGGSGYDTCGAIASTPEGFLLCGSSDSPTGMGKTAPKRGVLDFWVVAIDAFGSRLWDQSYGGLVGQALTAALPVPGGGFLLGGRSTSGAGGNKSSPGYGIGDFWIVRTDPAGNILGDEAFGGSQNDELNAMLPAADGGYLLVGGSWSGANGTKTQPCLGAEDGWVVKVPFSFPPRILVQPQGAVVSGGTAVSFSVSASALTPLTYQWKTNDVPIWGATNVTLTITNVQPSDGGRYTVVVSNDAGSVESEPAVLTYTDSSTLQLTIHPSLTIYGTVGKTYLVQYADNPEGALLWKDLGSLTMTNTPQVFVDLQSPVITQRIYRVLLAP